MLDIKLQSTKIGDTVKKYKINRNDKCPCGSGLKFKNCCINKPEYQK